LFFLAGLSAGVQAVVAGTCWLLAGDGVTRMLAQSGGTHAVTAVLLAWVSPLLRTDPVLAVLVVGSGLGTLLSLFETQSK
jgi:hypothetical protein